MFKIVAYVQYAELRGIMERRFCTYKRVGYFKQIMAESLGLKYTGNIYASPGCLSILEKGMEDI